MSDLKEIYRKLRKKYKTQLENCTWLEQLPGAENVLGAIEKKRQEAYATLRALDDLESHLQ